MKVCILSDIHGNLEALTAVFADMEARPEDPPDRIISLGDIIGYGPDPEAAMELVTARGVLSILGNHEMVLNHTRYMRWFNPVSQRAVEHSRKHLSRKSLEQIQAFPRNRIMGNLFFVHGVPPVSVFLYLFQLTDTAVMKRLDALDQDVVFVGHTHELVLVEHKGHTVSHKNLGQGSVILNPESKYIINAGSVGQPRDGDPSAKYLVYDTGSRKLEVRFVSYDTGVTAKKILDQGLPRQFADKLSYRFDH